MILSILAEAAASDPVVTGGTVGLCYAVVRVVERLLDRRQATKASATEELCTFESQDGGKIRELHKVLTRRDGNWSLVQVLEKNAEVLGQLLQLVDGINKRMEAREG